jgi:alpha-mannosidase
MKFTRGKIERIKNDLLALIAKKKEFISDIEIRHGKIERPYMATEIKDGFKKYNPGDEWAKVNIGEYAIFRYSVEIPENFNGQRVSLCMSTNKDGWDALNPQMLVFVNGKFWQGIDVNHRNTILTENATAGEKFDIILYAFAGLNPSNSMDGVRYYAHIETIDREINQLYYDMQTPLYYLSAMDPNNMNSVRILNILNDASNFIDLREPYSDLFYKGVKAAHNLISESLFLNNNNSIAHASLIGHTHIDVAWLWQYMHTRDKTTRSFSTVVRLMKEYPEYKFYSSQPQLYQFIKEDLPNLYEEIKQLIKDGRWEADGAAWVESDMNIPSGESLVRQLLFGKRFFKEEFDVDSKMLWLPDVFGYNAALPQILKKAGVDYFMTAKLAFCEYNRFPHDTFMWRGIDGTEILSQVLCYAPRGYNNMTDSSDILVSWDKYNEKYLNQDILLTFGYGDGGGGPTASMIESAVRMKNGLPGCPSAEITRADEYFKRLEKTVENNSALPVWSGELYYENHRGTYTSMAKNKKFNRKCEILYHNAELLSSINSALNNGKYPKEKLNDGWKKILLNQFHDVLPGSSIEAVYKDSDIIYGEAVNIAQDICGEAINEIINNININQNSLVVFNPHGKNICGIAEFESDKPIKSIELADGTVKLCQKSYKSSNINNIYNVFVENIPAKGFAVLKFHSDGGEENKLTASKDYIENKFYKIKLLPDGSIESIYDKKASRQIFRNGQRANVLKAFEDKPRHEDNWNLDEYYIEKFWEMNDIQSVEIIESGSVRVVIEIKRKFVNSTVTQRMIVYAEQPEIVFETDMDWKEKDIVVKAEFPVDVNTDKALYEIQFGYIERNTHRNTSWDEAKFEVCGHKWAYIGDNGYGIGILNDCKYGYDAYKSTMRLTLLRSGTYPNPNADKEFHTFVYAILPQNGVFSESNIVEKAHLLNNPLFAKVSDKNNNKSDLKDKFSLFECDGALLETIKMSEDDNGYILRIYEPVNRGGQVKIKSYDKIKSAVLCNLIEQNINSFDKDNKEITVKDNEIEFNIKPFEIISIRVNF